MSLISTNPATEQVIAAFDELSPQTLAEKIQHAQTAFVDWRHTSYAERSRLFRRLADLLRDEKRALASHATLEMGKPITQAIAEVEKCAQACGHFAEYAAKYLSPEQVATDAKESFIQFDPLGAVLAIMPWNFPFWQPFRFAAPALMAGNVALLKHASNVPQCAVAIEEMFKKAGFLEGVFQNLLIGSDKVADVIKHPAITAVTLTGSESAGSQVAEIAGREIKPTVLELGGSDAYIVLADADIDKAAMTAATARYQNTGQSCIAAKRFIVVKEKYKEFVEKFSQILKNKKVGDPMDEATDIGPLATKPILANLERQINESITMGAQAACGGKRLMRPGYFYEPTILTDVTPGMPVYREETFGPVAAVIAAEDENHAIKIANDTRFGLGASLWTQDSEKAKHLAADLKAGSVFINGLVKSDPRLPFGGIKRSGYGRELGSYGIKEFVNVKTIWIA